MDAEWMPAPLGAPTITAQSRSLRVAVGTPAGFLVEAEGVGRGYQWEHTTAR
ncbi:hypothetical protein [Variovorax sp. DT-64]|uniref:hypothetical protein n=1 Tax=Variovorax sp. DT-64 TaxID=3396160 RepID=UPI003F1D2601